MNISPLANLSSQKMKELHKNLEKRTGGDVLVIYGGILNGVEGLIKNLVEDLAKDSKNKKEKLYVLLTTGGGSLFPVQRMVTVFRHFYNEVNFVVPDYAFSAGTILCMSGDNIYMNYYSALGPIDPQVQSKDGNLVAALGYLDKIDELLEKAKNKTLTDAEFVILKDFDLAELRSFEQAKALAIDLLKSWLTKYKFKNWNLHSDGSKVTDKQKTDRAVEIAEKLSDNKKWKSHGRPITKDILETELKLQIIDYSLQPDLSKAITEYHTHMIEYIRNKKLQNFFQTRLFL